MYNSLHQPFPYRDTRKMKCDYKNLLTEDDCINADLNYYWMNIAGTLSYVLDEKEDKIPFQQIQRLRISFFDWFPQYHFLEKDMKKYLLFYRDYTNYEKARKLLLYYLAK